MKMNKLIIPLAVLLCLQFTGFVFGQSKIVPPKPAEQSFVFDYAGMLDADHADTIRQEAAAIKEKNGAELTIVTLETLDGEVLEEIANSLFNNWGIGDSNLNNGLLMLVIKDNVMAGKPGRVRLEVGYGLEGALPDGRCGRILDEITLPAWDRQEYSRGIFDTFKELASIVSEEYTEEIGIQRAKENEMAEIMASIIAILFCIGFVALFWYSCKKGVGGSGRTGGSYRSSGYSGGGRSSGGFGGGRSGGGGASR